MCYQLTPQKSSKISRYRNLQNTFKPSVRSRIIGNYKSASRYESCDCTLVSKKVGNIEMNYGDLILICDFCAASLSNKGVCFETPIDDCYDNCNKKAITLDKTQSHNSHETEGLLPESVNEYNFLHLFGPSPRSLFVRKNVEFLTNIKRKSIKLCRIEPADLSFEFKKQRIANMHLRDIKSKERVFEVITNDKIKMKIKPMQLKEPQLLLGFLKASLGLTRDSL